MDVYEVNQSTFTDPFVSSAMGRNNINVQHTRDEEFLTNISSNTVRYMRLFESAADSLVSQGRPFEEDVIDVLQVCICCMCGGLPRMM